MFETIVATDNFKGKKGKFVMANGDVSSLRPLPGLVRGRDVVRADWLIADWIWLPRRLHIRLVSGGLPVYTDEED